MTNYRNRPPLPPPPQAGSVVMPRSVFPRDLAGQARGISAAELTLQAQSFYSDLVFTAPQPARVDWTSGTLRIADGVTTYAISAGNSGVMGSSAIRYIYFDTSLSLTTLQVTTDESLLASDTVILLCVARRTTDALQGASFVVQRGMFGVNQDNLSPRCVTFDKIQVDDLTAISGVFTSLEAGTIEANVVVAAESFTAAIADFQGVTVNAELVVHDLIRFRTSGAIQVEDGRIMEFTDAGVDSGFGDLRYNGSGEMLARGTWVFSDNFKFGSRVAAGTPASFSADYYVLTEAEDGTDMYIPVMAAAW